jgi:hypothetical protein
MTDQSGSKREKKDDDEEDTGSDASAQGRNRQY